MKRLVVTLSSLALVGVACGRVSQNGDDPGDGDSGGSSAGALTGSGGNVSSSGGKTTGTGGASGPYLPSGGKAGASTMVGPGKGGATIGGTFALGGDSGVGGAEPSAGGAPPDAAEACALYCSAYVSVCPQAGFGAVDQCIQDCVSSLDLDSAACSLGTRAAYACIGNALLQSPADCIKGLVSAKRQCGAATPQVDACNATCVPASIYGDGTGCHAVAECNNVTVDLNCIETNSGNVPCTCSIDGKQVWDIATGFPSSKAGCIDEDLFRLCLKQLP